MVFSPLIPRRTDLTKEHIIGSSGGPGEEFFEHQQSALSSRKREITPTHGVCGQRYFRNLPQ